MATKSRLRFLNLKYQDQKNTGQIYFQCLELLNHEF
jgi:hypothetical protein